MEIENNEKDTIHIVVKITTRDRILKHGMMGDSYDDVLNKILDKVLQ